MGAIPPQKRGTAPPEKTIEPTPVTWRQLLPALSSRPLGYESPADFAKVVGDTAGPQPESLRWNF